MKKLLASLLIITSTWSCVDNEKVYMFEENGFESTHQSRLLLIDYKDSVKTIRMGSLYLWLEYEENVFYQLSDNKYINDEDTIIIDRKLNPSSIEEISIHTEDTSFYSPVRYLDRHASSLESLNTEHFRGKYYYNLVDSSIVYLGENNVLHQRKVDKYNTSNWFVFEIADNDYLILDYIYPIIIEVLQNKDGQELHSPFNKELLLSETKENKFHFSSDITDKIQGDWEIDSLSENGHSTEHNLQISDSIIVEFDDMFPEFKRSYKYHAPNELGVFIIEGGEEKFMHSEKYFTVRSISDSTLEINITSGLWGAGASGTSFKYTRKHRHVIK